MASGSAVHISNSRFEFNTDAVADLKVSGVVPSESNDTRGIEPFNRDLEFKVSRAFDSALGLQFGVIDVDRAYLCHLDRDVRTVVSNKAILSVKVGRVRFQCRVNEVCLNRGLHGAATVLAHLLDNFSDSSLAACIDEVHANVCPNKCTCAPNPGAAVHDPGVLRPTFRILANCLQHVRDTFRLGGCTVVGPRIIPEVGDLTFFHLASVVELYFELTQDVRVVDSLP